MGGAKTCLHSRETLATVVPGPCGQTSAVCVTKRNPDALPQSLSHLVQFLNRTTFQRRSCCLRALCSRGAGAIYTCWGVDVSCSRVRAVTHGVFTHLRVQKGDLAIVFRTRVDLVRPVFVIFQDWTSARKRGGMAHVIVRGLLIRCVVMWVGSQVRKRC